MDHALDLLLLEDGGNILTEADADIALESYIFRFANLAGIVFDASDNKTIFAEYLNSILDRLDALEGA